MKVNRIGSSLLCFSRLFMTSVQILMTFSVIVFTNSLWPGLLLSKGTSVVC